MIRRSINFSTLSQPWMNIPTHLSIQAFRWRHAYLTCPPKIDPLVKWLTSTVFPFRRQLFFPLSYKEHNFYCSDFGHVLQRVPSEEHRRYLIPPFTFPIFSIWAEKRWHIKPLLLRRSFKISPIRKPFFLFFGFFGYLHAITRNIEFQNHTMMN